MEIKEVLEEFKKEIEKRKIIIRSTARFS